MFSKWAAIPDAAGFIQKGVIADLSNMTSQTCPLKHDQPLTDMSYMMMREFHIHDFLHGLTGYDSSPLGKLSIEGFYLAQLPPHHTTKTAVSTNS